MFGYWGVASPLIGATQVRHVLRAIEMARNRDELLAILHSEDAREVAIDLIASENHIRTPRVYKLLVEKMAQRSEAQPRP